MQNENNLQQAISTDKDYLFSALAHIKQELEAYQNNTQNAKTPPKKQDNTNKKKGIFELFNTRKPSSKPNSESSLEKTPEPFFALNKLVKQLRLTEFEQKILLLCAGTELDSDIGNLIAKLQGNPKSVHPSFNLALQLFSGSQLNALAPSSALRSWNLVKIHKGIRKLTSPIEIEEHILYYLLGIKDIHPDLEGLIESVNGNDSLSSSQEDILEQVITKFYDVAASKTISLVGKDTQDIQALALSVANNMKHRLFKIAPTVIPNNNEERKKLLKHWNREARIKDYLILIDCSELNEGDKNILQNAALLIKGIEKGFIVNFPEKVIALDIAYPRFEVQNPSKSEQYELWKDNLPEGFDGIKAIISQFDLSTSKINTITAELPKTNDNQHLSKEIWKSCCVQTRPQIDELAQRVDVKATFDDIVLPPVQRQTLEEIVAQVKHRHKVYQEWGFANKSNRGLGISVLFAGASGTGKTMAAEVIAHELKLDLYQVDLSQVVNKYIGETEKNLKRIFDSAEAGGCIICLNEADALFGKRKEVSDQISSFNNIEVSYLLQRMESYQGLAILTTNMKNAIDSAFFRRIRFVLNFNSPDAALRAEIWAKALPETQNGKSIIKDLDYTKLARLNLSGGNIKNIALNAAFLAATRENGRVEMSDILKATKAEYRKLEKTLTRSETKDWAAQPAKEIA